MTSSVSGHVKGETGKMTYEGKPMWAHREATPDEVRARQILEPWFASARDKHGVRIPLSAHLARLHG